MPALEVRAGLSPLELLESQHDLGINSPSFLRCLDLCGSLPCGLGTVLVSVTKKMIKKNKGRIMKDSA